MSTLIQKTVKLGLLGAMAVCLPLSFAQAETSPKPQAPEVGKSSGNPQPPEPAPPVNPNLFKKFLVVDLSAQRVDFYEEGLVTFSTPASTGRGEKPTEKGIFVITDKHEKWTSTIYNVPMPHFLRLNGGDTGLHAGILSGYPGSAGCIRLPEAAATHLYEVVPVGTHVLIQGNAPDIEWIKAEYRKNSPKKYNSYSRNVKTGTNWKPPYPVVHTSWSKPEDSLPDPPKTTVAKPAP